MSNRGRINGRDFVPSRKHSREHFSTDSTARKPNRLRYARGSDIVKITPCPRNTVKALGTSTRQETTWGHLTTSAQF